MEEGKPVVIDEGLFSGIAECFFLVFSNIAYKLTTKLLFFSQLQHKKRLDKLELTSLKNGHLISQDADLLVYGI